MPAATTVASLQSPVLLAAPSGCRGVDVNGGTNQRLTAERHSLLLGAAWVLGVAGLAQQAVSARRSLSAQRPTSLRRLAVAVVPRRAVARQAAAGAANSLPAAAGIRIEGTGSAAPSTVVTNDDLSEVVDTSDEWIKQRTGIRCRHVLMPEESISSLSVTAAKRALESAQMAAQEVDLVILATSTPDDIFGSAAAVAAEIGASNAVAFDLTAACSGFVFGLVTASQYLRSGSAAAALVIGADCLSRYVDWSDRATCVLFGDGAGAVAIRATDATHDSLLGFQLGSDGKGSCHLGVNGQTTPISLGGGKQGGTAQYTPLFMNGKEVFRFATSRVPEVLGQMMERHGVETDDVDWLLLHQANRRIMDSAAKRFKIPQEKILCNLDEYGNTSAASIPLALDEAVRCGQVRRGHLIACVGFGAGLSWGGMLLRY